MHLPHRSLSAQPAPDLAAIEREAWRLLNGGRGRGPKPASVDYLSDRQLVERQRKEVPYGDNLDRMQARWNHRTGMRRVD